MALIGVHRPGDVTLRHVRDFVRQDAGQLVFVSRCLEQGGMHADVTAGQREGVDVGIVDHEERERVFAVIGICGDAVTDFVHVFGNLRIFDQLAAGANIAHDRLAYSSLFRFRQDGIGRAAYVRQVDLGPRHDRRKQETCACGQAQAMVQ
jgi:hypothetical protein